MPTPNSELAFALAPVLFLQDCLDFHPDPRQAEIASLRAPRVILNCTRQWGKSTLTAAMAVHRAWTCPDSLTLILSPSARQSAEFLRKAKAFVRRLGLPTRGDGDNPISLRFPNGSRVVGLPGAEATIRGFSAVSFLLIDEAARVPDELYRAVRPMLAVANGDLWLMSTPFGKRGFFYEEWTEGSDLWSRFSVPASECPRISPDFLEQERRALGEPWFQQEYMCQFIDSDDSLFSHDLVWSAVTPDVRPLF